MELRFFDDPAEFRARTESFLVRNEATNNLLFGILSAIERGKYEKPLMCALEPLDGVALMTPPHNLVLSLMTPETARVIADELSGLTIPGVNGPNDVARAFAERWSEVHGVSRTITLETCAYALTTVRAPTGVPGALRVATVDDADLCTAWFIAFAREALGEDPAPADARRSFDSYIKDKDADVFLWNDGGRPVSIAGRSGPTPNGIRINAVYTPPELRGRGYASACVAAISARTLDEGRTFCFLYTDRANPTSNKIYQQIGYEPVCDADVFTFGS